MPRLLLTLAAALAVVGCDSAPSATADAFPGGGDVCTPRQVRVFGVSSVGSGQTATFFHDFEASSPGCDITNVYWTVSNGQYLSDTGSEVTVKAGASGTMTVTANIYYEASGYSSGSKSVSIQ